MAQSLPPPFTPDSDFDSPRPAGGPSATLSITALARFEFEAGKSNDGTKVLMIEWEDDDRTRSTAPGGSWHVSWEGKQAVLPADEQTNDHTRRLYFLLPPHITIPPVVSLRYEPPSTADTKGPDALQLNPLPAIFPPELGATGSSAGRKGVLHTIWAKKRLQVLDKEIRDECQNNVEGIALQMAIQEKEWIEDHFGVGASAAAEAQRAMGRGDPAYPMGPTTPVSPSSGGKLGEKLKGLKLQTGKGDLSPKGEGQSSNTRHLLSPQSPDVAVSSFNSFHTIPRVEPRGPSQLATEVKPPAEVKAVAHYPPESIQAQQQSTNHSASGFSAMGSIARAPSADSGEELFAKALSPRSPDLPRSPFSFAPESLESLRM